MTNRELEIFEDINQSLQELAQIERESARGKLFNDRYLEAVMDTRDAVVGISTSLLSLLSLLKEIANKAGIPLNGQPTRDRGFESIGAILGRGGKVG